MPSIRLLSELTGPQIALNVPLTTRANGDNDFLTEGTDAAIVCSRRIGGFESLDRTGVGRGSHGDR